MHKELAVSLSPGDRRIGPPQHLASSCGQRRGNLIAHALMNGGVANHATWSAYAIEPLPERDRLYRLHVAAAHA